jgi:hypothetical protein
MRWRCNTARDLKMLIEYFRPSKLGLNNHPNQRGRLAAAHHIFAHAALPDVDAEFEQFAVDSGCTPIGILRPILRISSRTSREMTGRPGWPCRTFQVQKSG